MKSVVTQPEKVRRLEYSLFITFSYLDAFKCYRGILKTLLLISLPIKKFLLSLSEEKMSSLTNSFLISILNDFIILQLAEMVNLHFLSLLEALVECNSAILSKLMPIWSPVLFAHYIQVENHSCMKYHTMLKILMLIREIFTLYLHNNRLAFINYHTSYSLSRKISTNIVIYSKKHYH